MSFSWNRTWRNYKFAWNSCPVFETLRSPSNSAFLIITGYKFVVFMPSTFYSTLCVRLRHKYSGLADSILSYLLWLFMLLLQHSAPLLLLLLFSLNLFFSWGFVQVLSLIQVCSLSLDTSFVRILFIVLLLSPYSILLPIFYWMNMVVIWLYL